MKPIDTVMQWPMLACWTAAAGASAILLGWGWMAASCTAALLHVNFDRLRGREDASAPVFRRSRRRAVSLLLAAGALAGLILAIENGG